MSALGLGPDAVFHASLTEGTFKIQHCTECEEHFFYPRAICPHCGSAEYRWVEAAGKGTVYSVSEVVNPRSGERFCVALVDLIEGPRMLSRIVSEQAVNIGDNVTAYIDELDDKRLVFFRPASEPTP